VRVAITLAVVSQWVSGKLHEAGFADAAQHLDNWLSLAVLSTMKLFMLAVSEGCCSMFC
jgi:hypothetical protein